MDERRVIVIGAGAAGLSAAYALRKRRIPVLLLEANDKAGGRMAGDTIGKFRVETGAQLFSSGYTIALQLAEELGVAFARSPAATLSTIYNNHTNKAGVLNLASVFNFRNFRTFLASGIFSLKGTAQFVKFIRFMRRREDDFRSENYTRLEDLDVEASFAIWSRREFGDEFLEEFCRCAIASITLTSPERISALNGMMMLWATFLDNRHTLLTPERGVGHFSQQLARACVDVTRLETAVEQVVIENGRTIGVRTLEDGLLEADAVICATRASTTASLAPQIPLPTQEFLKSIRYNQCCHVVMGIDRHPLPLGHYFFMLQRKDESILDCFFDSAIGSRHVAPEGHGLVHAYPTENASRDLLVLEDDEISDRIIEEIRKFVPAMPKEPLFTRVYRWDEAVVLPYAGMMRSVETLRAQGFPNVQGLFLAGDYLDILANVNTALISGIRAAEEVTQFLQSTKKE